MLYQQAMMSGIGAVQAATGSSAEVDAAYDQSYNATYETAMRKFQAANAKIAIEGNIKAIKQDRILTDITIQKNKAEAQAAAKVSAAVSGARGGSVQDVIYQTSANAAYRSSEADKMAEQAESGKLSQIGSYEMALLETAHIPKIDPIGKALGTLIGSLDRQDIDNFEAYLNE